MRAAMLSHASSEPGGRAPAPGPLQLVQAFINTYDLDSASEQLSSPHALREWLLKRGLVVAEDPVTEVDLEHLIGVREALRAILGAHSGTEQDVRATQVVNRAARAARLAIRIDQAGQLQLVPEATGVDGAIGRLLVIAWVAEQQGHWQRLRACRQCQWIYYDSSKNRSSAWCSMSTCGGRAKARAYRRRKRDGTDAKGKPGVLARPPA